MRFKSIQICWERAELWRKEQRVPQNLQVPVWRGAAGQSCCGGWHLAVTWSMCQGLPWIILDQRLPQQ